MCPVAAMPTPTYLLRDSLAKHGKQEDGSDGRHHVTHNRVHVVKQLFTVCRLNNVDPDGGENK